MMRTDTPTILADAPMPVAANIFILALTDNLAVPFGAVARSS